MKGSTNLTGEFEAHDESANSSFEVTNLIAAGTVGYASYTLQTKLIILTRPLVLIQPWMLLVIAVMSQAGS